MSLTVKAFLQKNDGKQEEIRRFAVPADASSSYDYLSKKISEIYPSLRRGNFTLYWKDTDNDLVSFSTDEELMEALGFINDSILRVYIKELTREKEDEDDGLHPGVVCDGCQGPICGVRFKCFVCPDYDLCSSCEQDGKHTEHDMMKIPSSTPGNCGPRHPGPWAGPFGPHIGPFGPHGPQGGPFGPHGPHNGAPGPFVPPPHFRRWMQRFMKRWHNRNAPEGCTGFDGKESAGDKQEEVPKCDEETQQGDEETMEDEYLRDVGEQIAAMMDPLGIDVSVDVESKGRRPGCPFPNPWMGPGNPWMGPGRGRCRGRGRGHGGCPRGMKGPWGRGRRCNSASQPSGPAGEAMESDIPSPAPAPESTEPKQAEGRKSPVMMDAPKPDEDWTVLNNENGAKLDAGKNWAFIFDTQTQRWIPAPQQDASSTTTSQNDAVPVYPAQQPPVSGSGDATAATATSGLYPSVPPADPKIASALDQMMSMGFTNDGGWLTQLLQAKNGDIGQVLDILQPAKRVDRELPNGGHRA